MWTGVFARFVNQATQAGHLSHTHPAGDRIFDRFREEFKLPNDTPTY
jgi:hypothetical protein